MSSSRSHRPSAAEAIEATAAAWLAQRDDGFNPEQAAGFAAWRSADVRHEAAVQRLEATWSALQRLRDYRPEAARHPDRDLLGQAFVQRRPAFAGLGRLAALAAVLILVLAGWYGWERRERTQFATTVDGYERVLLADGSVAELNGETELDVRFSAGERRVKLRRGEAHFSVTRDPRRPFVVETNGVTVRAVGTAFNVRLGPERVEVLVTQGRVEVAPVLPTPVRGGDAKGVSAPGGALLAANERVSVEVSRESGPAVVVVPPVVEKVPPATIREALAWQGPRLVFTDTPLAEVIAQFNRRNAVQIELARPELGALPIGGSFRAENADAFVRLLTSSGDIVAERPEPHRIVLRAEP